MQYKLDKNKKLTKQFIVCKLSKIGATGGIRTPDLPVRSRTLGTSHTMMKSV